MLTLGSIKGVGSATIQKLNELDIRSVFELFSFFPSKYIDLNAPIAISEAEYGQLGLFEGQVERVSETSKSKNRAFYVTMLDTVGGKLHFRMTFYNMPFLHDSFCEGQKYRLLAKLQKGEIFNFVNPKIEKAEKISKLEGVYTVYPLRGVMGQNAFKNIVYSALDSIKGERFDGVFGQINSDMFAAFEAAHRPNSAECGELAIEKLASYDIAITLSVYKRLTRTADKRRRAHYDFASFDENDFVRALAFEPTPSQRAAFEDIMRSLRSDRAMSRIISGDVGSGKTAVAFFAMYAAVCGGAQAALMAPTEILARQHAANFKQIADRLNITYAALTSSTPQREKNAIAEGLKNGEIDCVIGTQSLISDGIEYKNLTLAVIDEQHKFGVNERHLIEKKGATDILSLTATPIPRSMALTFYEDISISVIKKRESATSAIKTYILNDEAEAVEKIAEAARKGKQAFIVCPAIRDAEGFELTSVESFMRQYGQRFETGSVRYLHGKMTAEQKNDAMTDFAEGKARILVATTVVEVGIDTLASEILVLNADRFGLASLHQLRGRVGRDGSEAHCYLCSSSSSQKVVRRLEAMQKSNDGQYLAELDFEMRGAGDFIGTKQSGNSYTPIFNIPVNANILNLAKRYADKYLKDLSLSELMLLTRRSEKKVREFVDELSKVTLNS